MLETVCREILGVLDKKEMSRKQLERIKIDAAKKHNFHKIVLNADILAHATQAEKEKFKTLLSTKPMRAQSGVTVVAIMCKPHTCPGKCTYCIQSDMAPKSYTGYEPAAMRARLNAFNPYKQVKNRLEQLHKSGHKTDKNELIIMGGTFASLPWCYQKWFIKQAFDAFNESEYDGLAEKYETDWNSVSFLDPTKLIPVEEIDLISAQKINETAKNRVISLIIETRPDWVNVDQLLELGGTRIELGAQSVYDEVLNAFNRGHSVAKTIESTKLLKDAGFKVDYHIMLGLPGSTKEKDIQMFKELFTNQDFQPDGLKIYPTGVIPGTILYEQWKAGKYVPADDQYILEVLTEACAKYIPPYTRIKRITRDIPIDFISAGYKKTNTTELIDQMLSKTGKHCKCIRCREVGHQHEKGNFVGKVELKRIDYDASGGKEIFLSYEDTDEDILIGFLRVRLSSLTGKIAYIREVHVYGDSVPIGEHGEWQHRGIGRKLVEGAERIARDEFRCKKIRVLSGVGVRGYYVNKLGYDYDGFYVHKHLTT